MVYTSTAQLLSTGVELAIFYGETQIGMKIGYNSGLKDIIWTYHLRMSDFSDLDQDLSLGVDFVLPL